MALFAVYTSPVVDVIVRHGVQYYQYTNDTQLRLEVSAHNTSAGMSVLAACTADVIQWYIQNVLQLNWDKSEALIIGTAHQLRAAASTVSSITVADVDLPLGNEMKVLGLGVILDRHLTFKKRVSAVAQSCNYHNKAIRHIRHLLTTLLAQMLAVRA